MGKDKGKNKGKGRSKKKPTTARRRVKRKRTFYLVRDKLGRFKDWVNIHLSIRADTPKKAKHTPKRPGYGHRGDYPKRKKKKKRFGLF